MLVTDFSLAAGQQMELLGEHGLLRLGQCGDGVVKLAVNVGGGENEGHECMYSRAAISFSSGRFQLHHASDTPHMLRKRLWGTSGVHECESVEGGSRFGRKHRGSRGDGLGVCNHNIHWFLNRIVISGAMDGASTSVVLR